MSQSEIRTALRKHLIALDPSFSTSRENIKFNPVSGIPYQIVETIPRAVQNPTMGDNYHREVGILSVVVCYPINTGEGEAIEKADQIKAHFNRGLTLEQSGVCLQINRTPSIGSAFVNGDRYCVPIRIEYSSNGGLL